MIPESDYQSKHEPKRPRMSPYTGTPYPATLVCGTRSTVTKAASVRGTAARDHLLTSLIPVANWKSARPEKLLWLYTAVTTQTCGTVTDLLRNSRKQIFNVAKFSPPALR